MQALRTLPGREHAFDVGFHARIDGDCARGPKRDAALLRELDVRPDANREDHELGGQLPPRCRYPRGDPPRFPCDRGHALAHNDTNALGDKIVVDALTHLWIEPGKEP